MCATGSARADMADASPQGGWHGWKGLSERVYPLAPCSPWPKNVCATGSARAVYTVKFAGAVYVLHAFQKKSKQGVKTPKAEFDLNADVSKLRRNTMGNGVPPTANAH